MPPWSHRWPERALRFLDKTDPTPGGCWLWVRACVNPVYRAWSSITSARGLEPVTAAENVRRARRSCKGRRPEPEAASA